MKTMQFARAGLLVALALAVTATAWGKDEKLDTRFYVTPMVSFGFFESDISNQPNRDSIKVAPEDSMGFTIAVGKVLNHYFNAELYYFSFSGVADKNVRNAELESHGFGIAGMYFPFRDVFPVYALAGFGFGQYQFSNYESGQPDPVPLAEDEADSHFFDIGIGVALPIPYIDFGYGARLRAEYRYRTIDVELKNDQDLSFDNSIASVGIVIPIGDPPGEPAVDSDGDGVLDKNDQCPGTPAGTKVDANGCKVSVDSDGDGVIDKNDQCPNTPPGTDVGPDGCKVSADSDGDGVLDKNDQCPNTPAGTKVDSTGCGIIVLQGVTFRFNQATLTAQAEERLDKVVQKLKAHPKIQIEVVGHTDSKGTAAYNLKLSKERAQSVKRYLVEHGIDPSRITTKGQGETQPIAPNTTPEGRAKNRRVEIHITDR